MATFDALNIGLSAQPEYPEQKDPQLYAELLYLRNALVILQTAFNILAGGTAGQHLTKVSGADFDVVWA